jgi:hypothetical protein
MKTKIILLTIFSILLLVVLQSEAAAQNPVKIMPNTKLLTKNWKHTQFATQTEAVQFINGEKGSAPSEFRVASVSGRGGYITFHVFYQAGVLVKPNPLWAAKRFNSADEAVNFISSQTAKEFRICGATTANQPQSFFVFYRNIPGGMPASWGWKLSETVDDAQKFLSREGGYTDYIRDAEVAAVGSKFYIFYRPAILTAAPQKPFPSWGWVKRETTESAVDILNKGTSNIEKMMAVARIAAVREAQYTVFYIFYQ